MTKLNTKSKLVALAAMTIIGLATIWAFNSRASARPMLNCPGGCVGPRFSFGMVGIAANQTARFSVVNVKKCVPPNPCTPAQVELRFVDSSGSPVTNDSGHPVESMVTLASGQSAFLDLLCPGGCGAPARVQFRAEVPSCIGCGNGNSKGTVLATLEIFDNLTGKTTLVMPDYPAISSLDDQEDER